MENIYKNRLRLLVSALRSGDYKERQSHRSVLRNEDNFSLNGVACEVYRLFTGQGKWEGSNFRDETASLGSFISCGCSNFYFGERSYSAIRLGTLFLQNMFQNGKSFKEIATIIESYLDE